jgi:hypothetical protein
MLETILFVLAVWVALSVLVTAGFAVVATLLKRRG